MTTALFESTLDATPAELFAWHARPGAFDRLSPPWQAITIERPAALEEGSRAQLRLRKGPFSFGWTAEHRDVRPGLGFTDVQVAGPFARWIHRHEFETAGDGALLRDRIEYAVPGGAIGRALAGPRIRRDLATTFAYRHSTTARDLARHAAFTTMPRLRVAVTGSSGLLGSNLLPFLTTGGHDAVPVRRGSAASEATAGWSTESGLLAAEALEPFDAVVHLAGETIAGGRWSALRKQRIRDSRVEGTRNLVRSLTRLPRLPDTLVCASAIGYYGDRGDDLLDESSAGGTGFLAEVCREWEAAAAEASKLGIRVVMLRLGVILTPAGGALAKMLPPFRLGFGGPLGHGRQIMSWVSLDDVLGAVHHALLDRTLSGPVNVVSPGRATNAEFTAALGRTLRRPAVVPAPRAALRLLLGEMADALLLSSARVEPQRLREAGFRFDDTDLDLTLARLLGRLESW